MMPGKSAKEKEQGVTQKPTQIGGKHANSTRQEAQTKHSSQGETVLATEPQRSLHFNSVA